MVEVIRQARQQSGGDVQGRYSDYTPEEAERICAWIASGRTLTAYCKQSGIGISTVYRWMVREGAFREAYAQAREDRTETQIEEIVDLSDEALVGSPTREQVEARKLAIDTRKWVIAKLNAKYSDQRQAPVASSVTFNIDLGQLSHSASPTVAQMATPTLGRALDSTSRQRQTECPVIDLDDSANN